MLFECFLYNNNNQENPKKEIWQDQVYGQKKIFPSISRRPSIWTKCSDVITINKCNNFYDDDCYYYRQI